MRQLSLIVVIACFLTGWPDSARAAPALAGSVLLSWLYDIEVPVDDQSPAARLAASRQALLMVLTRVTGLPSVPRSEVIQDALDAPDLYYNGFGFISGPTASAEDEPILKLSVQFDSTSVLRLVKQANLPVWRAQRPSIIGWVAVDQGGAREVIGVAAAAAGAHAFDALSNRSQAGGNGEGTPNTSAAQLVGAALQAEARNRGLPLMLPELDLAEQLMVESETTWSGASQALTTASERYQADVVLTGRVRTTASGQWQGLWEYRLGGQVYRFESVQTELIDQAAAAVGFIADKLAQRYAVRGRDAQQISLAVTGVKGADAYGQLLNYLEGFEFVDDVFITGVNGDELALLLTTSAATTQLSRLFREDGRLLVDEAALIRRGDMQLVWQNH